MPPVPPTRCQTCWQKHLRCVREEEGGPCVYCVKRDLVCMAREPSAERRPRERKRPVPMASGAAIGRALAQMQVATEHIDLLTQVHHAASTYYGSRPSRAHALTSMDHTALVSMGILLEETVRELMAPFASEENSGSTE